VIHAFDTERRTNARLMEDCQALGYLPGTILDLTYGKGAFWKTLPDLDVLGNDLDTSKGAIHFDFRAMPMPDSTFETVVFDPPYRAGGTPTTAAFDDAYGLDRVMSPSYVEGLIREGAAEAVRLARSFVLVKLQDHVSSGRLQPLSSWAIEAATEAGARLVDSLHVIGGRAQPKGTRQVRARHGYSTLLVFEKRIRS